MQTIKDFENKLLRLKTLRWSQNRCIELDKLIRSEKDLDKRANLISELNIHSLTVYLLLK